MSPAYVKRFPEPFEILNSSLYVEDFISSESNVNVHLKLMRKPLNYFNTFRKWKSNSYELRQRWEEHGLYVDEFTDKLNRSKPHLIPSNILGFAWDYCDMLSFNTQNLDKFHYEKS